jgi:hypothetical protein
VPNIPMFSLLKMVMEDTTLEFSEQMNEFLFRAYILEESITLILVKTHKILEEIVEKLDEESASRRSSFNS